MQYLGELRAFRALLAFVGRCIDPSLFAYEFQALRA